MSDRKQILQFFQDDWTPFYKRYLSSFKGKQNLALCPFHNDKKPSLSIDPAKGLYFCHGCGKKGDAFHFYAKLHGLDDKRDYPKILQGIASDFGIENENKRARIVRTYDYTDAQGNLLFQVCRMDPKGFRQRRPGKGGQWIWDLKGIEPVLFNLPEVVKASEVLIVEGEKDCETARGLGFTATTCPMGAKKWREQYNESLTGKDVVLIPDNDPDGREHMTQVAMSLNRRPKTLKWLDLPDLPAKGDLSDFAATFPDLTIVAERLAVMIEGATPYEPSASKSIENVVMTVAEFQALNIPERETLLYPWLRGESITLVSGWRGSGKTWFALGICDALTKAKQFGPWNAEKARSCLFLDGDLPASDLLERINTLECDSPRFHVYSDYVANQWGLPRAHLLNESWRDKMTAILKARHIEVFVIDNIASLGFQSDENLKKDWDPVNQWLLKLRFDGISTILLHHTNKMGEQRGTSAREDNIDISIILRWPNDYTPEQGARFVIHFSKARIATRNLKLIADTEFSLNENEHNKATWFWANVKGQSKRAILKMIDEGIDTKAICEVLGVSRQYVSKTRLEAIKQGYLTEKNRLTQSGFWWVSEDTNFVNQAE
jgi:hypothetical protein